MSSYKFMSSIGEMWAQRMHSKDKLKAWGEAEKKGYTVCAQQINDHEMAYWYEPNGSANAEEMGKAVVMMNKLGLRY